MTYSGFTFVHNALAGGYPIREAVKAVQPFVDEVVAVDMGSTDGTREVLESLGCRVIDGEWGTKAEMTLCKVHALHTHCKGDVIIHFEADEVWDSRLLDTAIACAKTGTKNQSVYRIQVVENFQRVRWYPELVHRVFPKGGATKDPTRGHTTKEHESAIPIPSGFGFLWDVTNCFRDQYVARAKQNAELWEQEPNLKRVPAHYLEPIHQMNDAEVETFLREPHWTWKTSPFNLPEVIRPLVGKTRYE